MIDRLNAIARVLYRARYVLIVLAVLSGTFFALSLFSIAGLTPEVHLVPAILVFCWSATLISFAGLLANVPAKPDRSIPWRRRLSIRLQRLFMSLLALLVISLSMAVLVLSWQLLRTWFSA